MLVLQSLRLLILGQFLHQFECFRLVTVCASVLHVGHPFESFSLFRELFGSDQFLV